MDAPADRSSSDLCRDCGLCCDGSIFDFVELDEDEVPSAASHGLGPEVGPGRARFSQPCRRFNAVCQIYPDRPLRCRRYRCALLVRLEDGELDLGTAHAAVIEARRLVNEADRTSRAGETTLGPVGVGQANPRPWQVTGQMRDWKFTSTRAGYSQ